MRYLKASVICFIIALIALSQIGCVEVVNVPVGKFQMYVTINVQDDWCDFKGESANGTINYNTKVRSISEICISRKSDNIERTFSHEIDHAWRNAVGLDAKRRNL